MKLILEDFCRAFTFILNSPRLGFFDRNC